MNRPEGATGFNENINRWVKDLGTSHGFYYWSGHSWIFAEKESEVPLELAVPPNSYQVGGTHYLHMQIQPWDALESWLSVEEFAGFLRGNCIKYLSRAGKKGPLLQDLEKAQHYLCKLIALEKSREKRNDTSPNAV